MKMEEIEVLLAASDGAGASATTCEKSGFSLGAGASATTCEKTGFSLGAGACWAIKFVRSEADLPAPLADFFALNDYKAKGICTHQGSATTFVGISPKADYAAITAAVGAAVRSIRGLKISTLFIDYAPLECEFYSIIAHIYGALHGLYSFDKYKSEAHAPSIKRVILQASGLKSQKDAQDALRTAKILAAAAAQCKDIVNEIPSTYTQESFAQDAAALADAKQLECKIFRDKELAEMGCEAFLAVNRASAHSAVMAHLAYKPQNPAKRVVFVGKGLVYDTGGLSLKPADFMLTMKADKSGAAAALAIIRAAAELALPLEVHAILGCAQNCISERSYMPDDVLRSREGKSIEVRNTDAEGRLVLADCLSYAQDLAPDLLIDLATLTGACVVGLGEYTSGVMGHNDALAADFRAHSLRSGELASVLHFNPHLGELIKSKIADLSNTASARYGGAITAGMFLGEFIREEFRDKWLHLDIAGPAYVEKPWGENAHGAGAAGVRMCVAYLLKLAREANGSGGCGAENLASKEA